MLWQVSDLDWSHRPLQSSHSFKELLLGTNSLILWFSQHSDSVCTRRANGWVYEHTQIKVSYELFKAGPKGLLSSICFLKKSLFYQHFLTHYFFHSFLKPFKWIKPAGNFLKDSFLNYCFLKFSFFFFLCLYGNQTSTCTYCGYGNHYSTISNVLDFVAEKKLK